MKILSLCLMIFLSACVGKSQESNFYSLYAQNNDKPLSNKSLIIGVEPVFVPITIDRPQIVSFGEIEGNLNISEFNRWSEPLSFMIQRVVAQDMSYYLPKSVVKPKMYAGEKFDFMVVIELNQLIATLGDKVYLDAWWTVYDKNHQEVAKKRTSFVKQLNQKGYDEFVKTQSLLLNQLSEQIVQKIILLKKE